MERTPPAAAGSSWTGLYEFIAAFFQTLVEVLFFWQLKIYDWWVTKPKQYLVVSALSEAHTFEEWEAAAFTLDELRGNDLWRQNPTSGSYDYRLIYDRLQALIEVREDDDILGLVNLLRSGLVRNLGNITASVLFNRAYAGTKLLIEDYVAQVALAINHVAAYPTTVSADEGLTGQAKLDLLHDTRQAFGRSALVLQGGALFGLSHLGVVRALHLRGLLPRIIVGSTTGALIAALVGVHTDEELLKFLSSDGIDLSAFTAADSSTDPKQRRTGRFQTFYRRISRFARKGYFLDTSVLEDCVRMNVGDMTFEEAYARTRHVLNITIPSTNDGANVPGLLNYITAPNVLIWSAAAASNAGIGPLYSPVSLLCKTDAGTIRPWSSRPSTPGSGRRSSYILSGLPSSAQSNSRDTPMSRVAELFNVNHFVVSQARPSIAPFLQTTTDSIPRHATATARRRNLIWQPIRRVVALESQHRLLQLSALGVLPASLARFMLDEVLPGESMTLAPELKVQDFVSLLDRPTTDSIESWILRGERTVWPAISAIRARCAIEFELDRAYQLVRRRKPMDAMPLIPPGDTDDDTRQIRQGLNGGGEKRRRKRAYSAAEEGRRGSKAGRSVVG